MPTETHKRIVFGVGEGTNGNTLLVLGVSRTALEHMLTGECNHFDLSSLDVPIQLVMFAGEDYDATKAEMMRIMLETGKPVVDETRRDWSIKEPE